MPGGVGGGNREVSPYPDLINLKSLKSTPSIHYDHHTLVEKDAIKGQVCN